MAEFKPSKKTADDFNNGKLYVDGVDSIAADDITNVIESQLYTQGLAVNTPDTSEANNVGTPAVEITTASDGSARMKFKNLKGASGKAATIRVGSVTTGEAGSQAKVVNSGTESEAVLDFTIPRGEDGETGDTSAIEDEIDNIKNGTTVVGAAEGAQYLSKSIICSNGTGTNGYFKICTFTSPKVSQSNSFIFLINGIYGDEPTSYAAESGIIEFDIRSNTSGVIMSSSGLSILSGNLNASDFFIVPSADLNTIDFYIYLQQQYGSAQIIELAASNLTQDIVFDGTRYTTAPSNAVYAVIRNPSSNLALAAAVGSSTQPVYFSADGVPVACGDELNVSVTGGAGYLANGTTISSGSSGAGWHKFMQVSNLYVSNGYSAILLVNGVLHTNDDTHSNSEHSGIIEIDYYNTYNTGATSYVVNVLAGNLTPEDFCLTVSGNSISIYKKLEQYQIVQFVQFSVVGNGATTEYMDELQSSAPSGAVYAVNRNYAAFDSEGHPFATQYVNTETDQLINGGKVFSESTWTPLAYVGLVNNDTAPLWQFTPAGIYYIPDRSNLLANKLIAYDSSKGLFVLGTNLLYNYDIPNDDDSTAIATTHWVNQKITSEAAASPTTLGLVYGLTESVKTAIGYNATVSESNSVAIGDNATASKTSTLCVGSSATASAEAAVAVGTSSTASGEWSTAIGAGATATAEYAAQIGYGENSNANTLQFLDHQIVDENGQIPASALQNANSISMIPYGGQATTLSALESGGVYSISANGYLRVAYQTTAADNYITMKQVDSSGADMWGALSNGQKSYGSGYPFIYMPVAAGDHIKVEFGSSVKIIQVQLIKVKGVQ